MDPAPTTEQLLAQAVASQPTGSPPTRSLLREEVYARIRTWIVEGVLPPETRLRDKEIAEALQVSRTPVREAIRRLQDEGLVVAEASRWTKVAPVDVTTADEIYPIIWTLERLAANLGNQWDTDRLTALQDANDRLAVALASHDALAASQADTDFHRLIVEAAGNRELSAIVEQVKVRLRRIEILYFGVIAAADQSVNEHQLVISALKGADFETAGVAVERNWRASLDRLHLRMASE